MSKVPCGGFKLDENFFGMNENDELSLTSGSSEGEAFKQLVTDGDGGVKWEDRLAYSDSRVTVDASGSPQLGMAFFTHISDEIPDKSTQAGNDCMVFFSNERKQNMSVNKKSDSLFTAGPVVFALGDNVEYAGIIFPKRGIYFGTDSSGIFTTGISFDSSTTPEITWDGNIETIKTIDPKYIPNTDVFFVLSGSGFRTGTDWYEGEDATIADIVSAYHDGGAKIFQMKGVTCIGISNVIGASASDSSSPFITYYDYTSKTVLTKS